MTTADYVTVAAGDSSGGRLPSGYYDLPYFPGMGQPPPPPDPTITSLVPTAAPMGSPVNVEVHGTNFEATGDNPGSQVEVDGVNAATAFVSATELTAVFTPAAAGTVQFTVRNHSGQESNDSPFVVTTTTTEEPEPDEPEEPEPDTPEPSRRRKT